MSQTTSNAIDPILDPEVHARRWQILGVMCLSLLVVMLANTSMNVALPILSGALGATSTDLQWIVDSYSLVFAGLLFTAGTVGDRYGRKLVLQIGLVRVRRRLGHRHVPGEHAGAADRDPSAHGPRRSARHAGDACRS